MTATAETPTRRRRRSRLPAVPPPTPVRRSQVHPAVMAHALRLAGGDASRITVVSVTEVLVR